MKLVSKIALSFVVASSFIFVGCADNAKPNSNEMTKKTIEDTSIGFRKVDLFSEDGVMPDRTLYSTAEAGSGKTIDRAFQDAPPMIPHTVEGMLPITISNNMCIQCHAPEVAESLGTLPYPKSHLTDFRPKHMLKGDDFVKAVDTSKNEVVMQETQVLAGARFNCSACHAPQSQSGQWVENNFKADFTTKDGAKRSNWVGDIILEGVDTIE